MVNPDSRCAALDESTLAIQEAWSYCSAWSTGYMTGGTKK